VRKPSALATDELRVVGTSLTAKIRAATGAPQANLAPVPTPTPIASRAPHQSRYDAVVIGISTGGPQALRQVLPALPASFPVPVAVVLHMPVGYTALYAEKLNEVCALEVAESVDGMVVTPGRILIAAAGRHLMLQREGENVIARASVQPLEKLHRPSADVLFKSAAEAYGGRVLAVVMTGMGDDGKEGAGWVKAAGGAVITEDEKSCVIYGMPRSVVEAGLSDESVPLGDMARAITARL
jgi:two-component system, chemotaxis family, protein-glutamate methylesterase/glutaminase